MINNLISEFKKFISKFLKMIIFSNLKRISINNYFSKINKKLISIYILIKYLNIK